MRLQWKEGLPAQPDPMAPRLAPLQSPPVTPVQPTKTMAAPAPEPPAKLLIVGPDINLSGEITACDRLVVEGSVQVTLNRTRAIEIAETGRFTNGKAEVDEAEIAGVYEGSLTVRKRLLIRATGRSPAPCATASSRSSGAAASPAPSSAWQARSRSAQSRRRSANRPRIRAREAVGLSKSSGRCPSGAAGSSASPRARRPSPAASRRGEPGRLALRLLGPVVEAAGHLQREHVDPAWHAAPAAQLLVVAVAAYGVLADLADQARFLVRLARRLLPGFELALAPAFRQYPAPRLP